MEGRGWHREDIKAELRKRHGNLTNLAIAWGFHRSTVSNAIDRPGHPAVDFRIATALGVTPHILWPERWTPEGVRAERLTIEKQHSRPETQTHRQKSEAA